jgi:hypothetical protein
LRPEPCRAWTSRTRSLAHRTHFPGIDSVKASRIGNPVNRPRRVEKGATARRRHALRQSHRTALTCSYVTSTSRAETRRWSKAHSLGAAGTRRTVHCCHLRETPARKPLGLHHAGARSTPLPSKKPPPPHQTCRESKDTSELMRFSDYVKKLKVGSEYSDAIRGRVRRPNCLIAGPSGRLMRFDAGRA